MKWNYAFLMSLMLVATTTMGQKLKQSGDLTFLQGHDKVNVEFDYDGVVIGKKDRKSEEAYKEEMIAKREEAEPGAGERWLNGWETDRERHYEPSFLELINKVLAKKYAEFGDFPEAKYTLTFKTTMIETGWNIGIMRQPAEIDAVAIFTETANPENELARVTITAAPGSTAFGGDYDVATRMSESYAISGKRLGALLKKKAY